ncbi:MAG TPA: DUF3443 family protein, partial [Candidatus Binatia bacterium]|nr:DUF3443 family protein [Candidatus Binatia bacterium]
MISRRFLLPAIFLSLAAGVGCGGGTSSSNRSPANTITTSGNNVVPITVNLGPTGNYADGAFASVTLCAPGTSNCQTIDGVLVDTGSSGLRILSSLITVPLTPVNAPDGNPMVECFPFVSGYTWGAVET